MMMRSVLSFFSMLALGVIALGVVGIVLPSLEGGLGVPASGPMHFQSAFFGLGLGLLLGFLNRYNWGDVPRRLVTWVLIRERQFFYYALIAGCIAVLVLY